MPWFRLEDSFYDNPKVHLAGNAAIGLWIRAATWSARHLTDGHIPAHVAHGYGTRREIDRLLATNLWQANGNNEYVIPDYLDYNPSADEVKRRRSDDVERKRAGGLARVRTGRRDPQTGKFT